MHKQILDTIIENDYIQDNFQISYYGPGNDYIELYDDNTFYIEPKDIMGSIEITVSDKNETEQTFDNIDSLLEFIKLYNVQVTVEKRRLSLFTGFDYSSNIGVDIDDLLESLNKIKEDYPTSIKIVIDGNIDDDGESLCCYINRYETQEEKLNRCRIENDVENNKRIELSQLKERVRQLEYQLNNK